MRYFEDCLRVKMQGIAFLIVGLLTIVVLSGASVAHAQSTSVNSGSKLAVSSQVGRHDLSTLKLKIVDFLNTQTIGYPGEVSVNAGAIDPHLRLAQCPEPQVFLPKGSRAWGKTSVGVRCNAPSAWTIYVQANVNVSAQYLVAAVPLAQGHVVAGQDLIFETGDLTQLPAGIFTELDQAVGRLVNVSMNAGTVIRQEMLKIVPVVQQGQTVSITTIGRGFRISAEGKAITKANEGQLVQVKVASGQVVTGIARQGGLIEVGF